MAENNEHEKDFVVERILSLIEAQKVNDRDLENYIGVGRGMVSHWRYDGSTSYLRYIIPICKYLNTSPNYIFYGTEQVEDPVELTPVEKEIIKTYRKLSSNWQSYVHKGICFRFQSATSTKFCHLIPIL